MLAKLQQAIAVTLAIFVLASVAGFWVVGRRPLVWLGPAVVVAGYGGVLALEFWCLWRSYDRRDSGRPTVRLLARAWLREVGVAPRIFLWAQPFRSQRFADVPGDPGSRGVVLVHGLFCNRGFWNPWLRRLRREGVPFVAVDLEPLLGSIDRYAAIVDAAVATLERSTGRPPIVVAHSMGGLAARAWLHRHRAADRCRAVVTIATPHAGTWMGRFARGTNAREMLLGSPWLVALADGESDGGADAERAPFTCWWSDCDNIVFPTRGATLPGADNRLVRGQPHVALAFHPPILDDVVARCRAT